MSSIFDFNSPSDTSAAGIGAGAMEGMSVGAAAGPWGAAAGAVVGAGSTIMGPDYDPANGGEVDRQLLDMPEWTPEQRDAYKWFLQTYHPGIWQSGDIWDAPNSFAEGHPSRFRDRYLQLVSQGYQPGGFLPLPDGGVKLPEEQQQGATAKVGGGSSSGGGGTLLLNLLLFVVLPLGIIWGIYKLASRPARTKRPKAAGKGGRM